MSGQMIKAHPSWYDIEKSVAYICNQMLRDGYIPDYILGVSRGGLVPAVIMSHILNVPLIPIKYSSSAGEGETKDPNHLLPSIPFNNYCSGMGSVPSTSVCIVDDIVDSGHTLNDLVKHYSTGVDVKSAAVYYKTSSIIIPDYMWKHIPEDSPWIEFPYE